MTLSTQQTNILLDIVSNGISNLTVEKEKLKLIVDDEKAKESINVIYNKQIYFCLKFKEMADLNEIDEVFIEEMTSDFFNFILELIETEINFLGKAKKIINNSDSIAFHSLEKRIELLEELKANLRSLFNYF